MSKSIIDKIKLLFSDEKGELTFVDAKTKDGKIVKASAFENNESLFEVSEDGESMIEDGEFILEDGTVITVEDSKIVSVVAVSEEVEEVEEVENFDIEGDGIRVITEAGEIAVGDAVVALEDGAEVADGEYTIGEVTFVVKDSVVESIVVEIEEEVPAFDEAAVYELIETKISELMSKFDETNSKFEALEAENIKLKEDIAKFSKAPSTTPTSTKKNFKNMTREEKLKFFSK